MDNREQNLSILFQISLNLVSKRSIDNNLVFFQVVFFQNVYKIKV